MFSLPDDRTGTRVLRDSDSNVITDIDAADATSSLSLSLFLWRVGGKFFYGNTIVASLDLYVTLRTEQ